jgi:glutathione S-transferase
MTITLYGSNASRATRNLWVLEELNLPYQQNKVNAQDGSSRSPEYLAINPLGKVPSLKDGDAVMFESLGINLYLAQKYGAGKLWPKDWPGQAKCLEWTLWCASGLEGFVVTMLVERLFKPAPARSEAAYAAAAEKLAAELAYLDGQLAGKDFLVGGAFTIADLNIACVLGSLARIGYGLADYPNVKRWLDGCLAREAQKRVAAMPRP